MASKTIHFIPILSVCLRKMFWNFSENLLEIFAGSALQTKSPVVRGEKFPVDLGSPVVGEGGKSLVVPIGQIYTTYICQANLFLNGKIRRLLTGTSTLICNIYFNNGDFPLIDYH